MNCQMQLLYAFDAANTEHPLLDLADIRRASGPENEVVLILSHFSELTPQYKEQVASRKEAENGADWFTQFYEKKKRELELARQRQLQQALEKEKEDQKRAEEAKEYEKLLVIVQPSDRD